MWILQLNAPLFPLLQPNVDTDSWVEFEAPKGDQGDQGEPGTSIQWLGSAGEHPSDPDINQAYYNTTDKKAYVYNGAWNIMAQDGSQGPQGIQGSVGADGKSVLNGTANPTSGVGNLGDFYINTTTNLLFGPKTAGGWGSGLSLVGPTGPQGIQGEQGIQGLQGLQGPQGLQGAQGIQGIQGSTGVDGKTVLNGTSNPTSGIGTIGDFFINTATNNLFGPKLAEGWGTGILLIGPQGPIGPEGPAGPLVGGTSGQSLIHDGTTWSASSNIFTDPSSKVGIGTLVPSEKLDVDGNIRARGKVITEGIEIESADPLQEEPIFVVRNNLGQIVFAVYESGVRMYVEDGTAGPKTNKAGFAIGGLTGQKGLDDVNEYFRVTPDSVRIYLRESADKTNKAGFAIGGLTGQKLEPDEYLRVTRSSTRISMDADAEGKADKAGFAIGGLTGQKGGQEFLRVTRDSTRVYFDDNQDGKTNKAGFAIGGLTGQKLEPDEYLRVTRVSTRISIDTEATDKTNKAGFAIGGLTGQKLDGHEFLRVTRDSTRIYIDDTPGKTNKAGFAIGGLTGQKNKTSSSFFNITPDETGIINPGENRILWYPIRNAFLAGNVQILNPTDVGENSMAIGYRTKAKGNYSQALGYQTQALGVYSTALGRDAIAQENSSFAFGFQAQALQMDSYALGAGAIAEGIGSYAIGSIGRDTVNFNPTDQQTIASGNYSFAIGLGARAIGNLSMALGNNTLAQGKNSFAAGVNTKAIGNYTVAMGSKSEATHPFSVAIGSEAKATNNYAVSFGDRSLASGHASFATGSTSTASGGLSFVSGYSNTSSGYVSTSFGRNNQATGEAAIAAGYGTIAGGNYSFGFGEGIRAQALNSFAIGCYNVIEGNPTEWIADDPLFVIGNGQSHSRNNAFVLTKRGYVGIGNNFTPTQRLDINGQIRIRGGSPGAGKLLTSDVDGVGTWSTLAISSTTGTLAVNRGGTGRTSLAANKILVGDGTNAVLYPTNLHWDNTNSRLGIGSTIPQTALHLNGSTDQVFALQRNTETTGNATGMIFKVSANTGNEYFKGGIFYELTSAAGTGRIHFATNNVLDNSNVSISDARMTIVSDGKVGIGTNAPTQLLDINGQIRIRGGSPAAGSVLVSDANGVGSWSNSFSITNATGTLPVGSGGTGRTTLTANKILVGNGTTGVLQPTNLHWDNSNSRLGIGTASPQNSLHLSSSSNEILYIQRNSGTISHTTGMLFKVSTNTNNEQFKGGIYYELTSSAGIGRMHFATNNVASNDNVTISDARMTIVSDGKIGIGTNAPSQLLDINGQIRIRGGSPAAGRVLVSDANGVGSWSNSFSVTNATGTLPVGSGGTGQTTLTANKILVGNGTTGVLQPTNLHWDNTNSRLGIGTASPSVQLDIRGTGGDAFRVYHGSYSHGIVIDPWNSTESAVNIDPAEASQAIYFGRDVAATKWVFQSGSVGIGSTSPNYQLELSTNSAAKPSSSAWTISSDIRLKDVKGTYQKGLKEILLLDPIVYRYKIDNPVGIKETDTDSYGFSAQDVQKIFPEAVGTSESGYLDFNIHPILIAQINAIKELNEKLEAQQKEIERLGAIEINAEIEQLKMENLDLKTRIERLEELLSKQ
jgi:hypothetical protein